VLYRASKPKAKSLEAFSKPCYIQPQTEKPFITKVSGFQLTNQTDNCLILKKHIKCQKKSVRAIARVIRAIARTLYPITTGKSPAFGLF